MRIAYNRPHSDDELPLSRQELLAALLRDMERAGDWTDTAEVDGIRINVTRELRAWPRNRDEHP